MFSFKGDQSDSHSITYYFFSWEDSTNKEPIPKSDVIENLFCSVIICETCHSLKPRMPKRHFKIPLYSIHLHLSSDVRDYLGLNKLYL